MGTLGRIFGESVSSHQAERLSWATVQGDPWYKTGGDCITNTIQCGGQQCDSPLAITDGGVLGWYTGRTVTCGGTELGFFCADDGLLGSWDPEWIQGAINVPIGIFWRIRLADNVAKSKKMKCQPVDIRSGILEEAFGRSSTGKGETYREQPRETFRAQTGEWRLRQAP